MADLIFVGIFFTVFVVVIALLGAAGKRRPTSGPRDPYPLTAAEPRRMDYRSTSRNVSSRRYDSGDDVPVFFFGGGDYHGGGSCSGGGGGCSGGGDGGGGGD
ncbi:hypothetical protein GURKE_04340 [Brevundimonas phage vB_BpoS-Gurke]|uniref:Uncharacterized protein n=1 Tax=Brevundimonas phage vB_BpoS-Gurke TaxID=2948599 RepID=A0A9E7N231_9CAUD|nr:hypothetical protein GURKE_04340 [Brevundimonas phage vB_BpoS-Gurke]